MGINLASTPFGSRPMTLAQLAVQRDVSQIAKDSTVDKWQVHRWLCEAKHSFGLNDRSLAVLSALLSFYPEQQLSLKGGMVVFPSNKQLALRAHAMAEATLRRHLSALVEAGIILRQDSPNGKRYAHRSKDGGVGEAYGFSLAPLLAKADQFRSEAERLKAEAVELRKTREHLTLLRRDIAKLIELATSEAIAGPWQDFHQRFRAIVDVIPRRAERQELANLVAELDNLHQEIDKALKSNEKVENLSGNESQIERHHYESDSESHLKETVKIVGETQPATVPNNNCSLDLILKACPEINAYVTQPIRGWQDMFRVTDTVRTFLGIDKAFYMLTQTMLGTENTSALIAYLLQRFDQIRSAPAYLRVLSQKLIDGKTSAHALMLQICTDKLSVSHSNNNKDFSYQNLTGCSVS